ncbi:MAG TPA: hypothetical protein VKN99_12165 [Polyangia bacterium]|nr:hypothetical protein [Polyangia bacterium]
MRWPSKSAQRDLLRILLLGAALVMVLWMMRHCGPLAADFFRAFDQAAVDAAARARD